MLKAKFIKRDGYTIEGHHPILLYEYRNRTYEVIDYGWSGGSPLAWQHGIEQSRIDADIEKMNKPKNPDYVSEDAQKGLDKFFQYMETGNWED